MKIKMTVSMAGPDFSLNVGEETERFGPAEASRLINSGFAEAVGATIERATVAPAKEQRNPLDHDGDGKPGGSIKGKRRTKK